MSKRRRIKKATEASIQKTFDKVTLLWLGVILLLSIIVFSPTINNGFVTWDDDWYVYENPQITNLSASTIPTLFTEFYKGQYGPVSTLILGAQYHIGNNNPTFFHFGSLIFHLINIVLVFWLSQLLFRKLNIAIIITVLFAIHGLQAEVVSWISAQKVVLYSMFFLASVISYVNYLNKKKLKYYWLSMLWFIVSFMAKEQAVTLSISLIAIDYLYGRKLLNKKVIIEKLPFLALALVMGVVTIYSSRTGEFFSKNDNHNILEQLIYASYAFTQYIIQIIMPYKLSAFHPYPNIVGEGFPIYLALFIIPVAAMLWLFIWSFKKHKVIAFGIMFFVMNIALVLQIMPLRDFITADRYIYIPAIGFFAILAYYLNKYLEKKKSNSNVVYIALGAYIIVLSAISFVRSDVWKDSITLFTDATSKYPKSSVCWNNRGLALENLGKHKAAIEDYKKAIKYNPGSVFCYNNIAISYAKIKQYDKAFKMYDRAIQLRPDFAQAYYNRADAKSDNGKYASAIGDYDKFLELKPNYVKAYISRGIAKARAGNFENAIPDLNTALKIQPNNADAYLNRGVIYLNLKKYNEAILDFNSTLKFKPNFNYAFFNRGIAKISTGDKNGGCNDLHKANNLGFKQAATAIQQYCK